MWILKGLLLGLWLFSFGTFAYLYLVLFRRVPAGTAIGVDVFKSLLVLNPYWWFSMAACLAIGLFATRSWSGRPALWIALIVTELLPVGFLVMFLMLVNRNKEMIERMK